MNWMQLVAAFINGVVVYLVVWGLGLLKPILIEKWPWAWTALGALLGIIIPIIANALTTLLGFPIDLSPILNVFAGVVATMFTMQARANIKIKELRVKAGIEK